jgi:DNA-binding response OmpR family regulator
VSKPDPTILIVDDDATNRIIVGSILEDDYRVLKAADGSIGLAIIAREPVDLVLLDVVMPGMSGFEVCGKIKEGAGEEFLPVILLTALSDQEDRDAGLAAGADDFLSKPVNPHELRLRVRALLRIRTQERLIETQRNALERARTERAQGDAGLKQRNADLEVNLRAASHELKSINAELLNALRVTAERVSRILGELPPGQRACEEMVESLTRITRDARRMSEVIDALQSSASLSSSSAGGKVEETKG